MPVRQPTGKLRKGKKKIVKGPESRVRGIKTESGWENALKASDGRYLVVHVMSVRPIGQQASHTIFWDD